MPGHVVLEKFFIVKQGPLSDMITIFSYVFEFDRFDFPRFLSDFMFVPSKRGDRGMRGLRSQIFHVLQDVFDL